MDLGEFVATVIPDFRQQSNIASLLYSTYTIIGAGGGGTVIRATRRDNGEEIAVKLTGASDLSFFPMSRYYEPHMSGLAKSALLQDKNITDFYPKLIGVYRGPCVIMNHCLSKSAANKFIIYTEMTLINAIEKPDTFKGQYFTDNIAFEALWNTFCSRYIGKFVISDVSGTVERNFVLGEVPYDRAYHVSYKGKKGIFLFSKKYPTITQVDLDVEYPEKYFPKIFSINYPYISEFGPSGDGYRLLKKIEVARENKENDGRTIFDFLWEHFAKYIVSENDLPQDNIRHFSIPEKFMALIIGDNNEVVQEKEL